MAETSTPLTFRNRIRFVTSNFARNGLEWLVLDLIWQLGLVSAVLFGLLFWEIGQYRTVVTTTPAGKVHSAGMQSDSTGGWVQTDSGMYFLCSPLSVAFQEPLSLQTRGEGSKFLCGSIGGCVRLTQD